MPENVRDRSASPDRKVVIGLERSGIRGGQRLGGQLYNSLQHGESRPAGSAHGRFHRGSAKSNALKPRVPHAPKDLHKRDQPPRNYRRVQHSVCPQSQLTGVLHNRGERALVQELGFGLQGNQLPARVHSRQVVAWFEAD